jgi:hypothetical protein
MLASLQETLATGIVADGAAGGALLGFGVCLSRGQEDFDTIAAYTIAGAIGNIILFVL